MFKKISFYFYALFFISAPVFSCLDDDSTPKDDLTASLSIVSPTFHFEKGDNSNTSSLAGIATLKNSSQLQIFNIVIEAKFFNKNHEMIDVITQPLYGIVADPSKEVSFKVQDNAAMKDKDSYSSIEMRVVSSEQKYSYQDRRKDVSTSSKIMSFVKPLYPMIIFFIILLILIKYANRKGSYQRKIKDQIENQTEILKNQSRCIERIADAIEKHNT